MQGAKILISLPDELCARFRAVTPRRQRSKVIRYLIEKEVDKREKTLYECALAIEKDEQLQQEAQDWSTTINDGINEHEAW